MKNSQPRYISSPKQLKAQIKIQHDIDIELTDTDIICLSCYKGFHKILENPLSLDSNLEELIHSLEAELAPSQTAVNVSVDQSILSVTLVVATHLLRNEAILLSDAYDMFTQSITESSTPPQITPNATLSKRAFHKRLISSLQEHLECRTVEQSVGIILYRTATNVMDPLPPQCNRW